MHCTDNDMNGSLTLREHLGDVVRLKCEKCGREGRYRKASLIDRFGADMRLPDLRQEIAKCERRSMLDQCGAYFVDLKPRH
jgi:hypothetical protein